MGYIILLRQPRELAGGYAGITEDAGYEGLSSGSSKPEAGHLPVFETGGMTFKCVKQYRYLPKNEAGTEMVARQPFLAAVQARKDLRYGSGGLAWMRSGASSAKRWV